MKKCLPSIVSAALCLSLVMTPFVPVAAAHADEGSLAESSEIYVGDNGGFFATAMTSYRLFICMF